MTKRFVSVGEAMIEISGGMAKTYGLGFAGDTLNTAWYARALLRHAWSVDYVTALGDDLYSKQMLSFLDANAIGTAHIQTIAGKRPGLYLIHQAEGDRHFTYWRDQSAAKLMTDNRTAFFDAFAGADLIYFSGISLAILAPRARGRLMKAITAAREAGARVAFDPNVRPALWSSQRALQAYLTAGATISNIVLPTHADEASIFGDESPEATAERYLGLGVEEVVVKDGAKPALVATSNERVVVEGRKIDNVVDATGAGDSFNGAYLAARLTGKGLRKSAEAGHLVAGTVIGHKGALIDPALLE